MLNTFDENNNEMMLAAIQELTADIATAQSKIAELEKGGGGGGNNMAYIEQITKDGSTYMTKIININDVDFTKPIEFKTNEEISGFTMHRNFITAIYSDVIETEISVAGLNSYLSSSGEWIPVSGTKKIMGIYLNRIEQAGTIPSNPTLSFKGAAGLQVFFPYYFIDTETGNFLYSVSD